MDLKCSIIHKQFFFSFATVLLSIPKFSATENCWGRCEKGQKKKKKKLPLLVCLSRRQPATPASEKPEAIAGGSWLGTIPACLCCMWICIWEGAFRGRQERLVLNMATGNHGLSKLCYCEFHCLQTLKCFSISSPVCPTAQPIPGDRRWRRHLLEVGAFPVEQDNKGRHPEQ